MAAAQSPNALDACCLFGERKTITERGSDRMLPEIHSESGVRGELLISPESAIRHTQAPLSLLIAPNGATR